MWWGLLSSHPPTPSNPHTRPPAPAPDLPPPPIVLPLLSPAHLLLPWMLMPPASTMPRSFFRNLALLVHWAGRRGYTMVCVQRCACLCV